MKRSEALAKLQRFVVSPHEIITQANYDAGVYADRAERLLTFIEKELGMKPPSTDRPAVIGRDRHGNPAAFDVGRSGYHRHVWECEDAELEQLRKGFADDTWQEPED